MHLISIVAGFAASAAALAAFAALSAARPDAPVRPVAAASNPVVVELFTSEGCSSCPPADDNLARLASKAAKEPGSNIVALAFHVDYWDDLGHKDPFASPAFTERQRAYARALSGRGLYTPQMIINGRAEFTGSDAIRADREIDGAAKLPPALDISISAKLNRPAGGERPATLEVVAEARKPGEGDAARPAPGTLINFALVEDGLSTAVKRGENAGRTLRHQRVVRAFAFKEIGAGTDAAKPSATLDVPRDANLDRCTLIVYAQDRKSWAVLGAAQSDAWRSPSANSAPAAPRPSAPPSR